jgi:hypothetical protein
MPRQSVGENETWCLGLSVSGAPFCAATKISYARKAYLRALGGVSPCVQTPAVIVSSINLTSLFPPFPPLSGARTIQPKTARVYGIPQHHARL